MTTASSTARVGSRRPPSRCFRRSRQPGRVRPPLASIGIFGSWSLSMSISLAQELAVAPDDRQVDELRAGVVLRRIADVEAAEVHVLHFFERVDQAFARRIAARPAQRLDHHLGVQEAFHGAEVVVGVARLLGELLVFLDYGYRRTPRE